MQQHINTEFKYNEKTWSSRWRFFCACRASTYTLLYYNIYSYAHTDAYKYIEFLTFLLNSSGIHYGASSRRVAAPAAPYTLQQVVCRAAV